MFNRLFTPVTMRFERQEDQPHYAAIAPDRLVHTVALYRERPVIVVGLPAPGLYKIED